MFESVSGAINKANDLLGGGAGGDGTTGKPEFRRVGALSPADNVQQGSAGANAGGTPANAMNLKPPIEFIHFGKIHGDSSKYYEHEELQDTKDDVAKLGRALMFRNALEREALLLDGFISATKEVLQEYKDNRGLLGEVGAAAEKLFGSGAAEPSPDELDAFKDKVSAAGGKINASDISYQKIHQAGIDLNQARADYLAFTKKLDDFYLKPPSGGGAGLTSLPGAAKAAAMVRKIIFKMFDIYVGMFLALRREFEDDIEEQSYQMTLKAITDKQAPVFPVWFPIEEAAAPPAEEEKKEGGLLSGVSDAIGSAKEKIDDTKKDIKEFIEREADVPAPGDGCLDAAFAALFSAASGDDELKKKSKQAPDLIVQAFTDVLAIGTIPPFLQGVMRELTSSSSQFLQAIYVHIMKQGAAKDVTEEMLMEVGRKYLIDKIMGIIISMTSLDFLNSDAKAVNVQGMGVSGKDVTNKVSDTLNEEAGQHAEVILQLAVGQLAAKLNAVRADAEKNKSLTMEVFLGHTPHYLALMVRNTFFPIWDIIVEKVFGAIAGPLAGAASPIKSALGTAKDAASKAKDIADRANKVQDQLGKGVNLTNPDDLKKLAGNVMGGDDAASAAGGGSFPGGARIVPGKSKKIEKSEIEDAEKQTQSIEQYIVA